MKASQIVSEVLKSAVPHIVSGVSTQTLNDIMVAKMEELDAVSFNKGYHPSWARIPFPSEACISINNEIAHGFPRWDRILRDGDLVTIDFSVVDRDGDCGDAAITVGVGSLSKQDEYLLRYGKKVLYAGISVLADGTSIADIARAMNRVALERNYAINRSLCGHGIGKKMHEDPDIYHTPNDNHADPARFAEYEKKMQVRLEKGMIVCLEPCLTFRDKYGVPSPDGWTFYTADGRKSVMFEHMVKILSDGYEILTDHFGEDTVKKDDN